MGLQFYIPCLSIGEEEYQVDVKPCRREGVMQWCEMVYVCEPMQWCEMVYVWYVWEPMAPWGPAQPTVYGHLYLVLSGGFFWLRL